MIISLNSASVAKSSLAPRVQLRKDDNVNVLSNISLQAEEGDRIGVIGLNGAGKSTLLRCIAGTIPLSSGQRKVKGKTSLIASSAGILDLNRTVKENIELIANLNFTNAAQKKNFYATVYEHLNHLGKHSICGQLSLGQKSLIGFIIQLHLDADILLIDEALSAGDIVFHNKASEMLFHAITNNKCSFIVTHSLELLPTLCNRVIVMNKGSLVCDSTPQQSLTYYTQMALHPQQPKVTT